MLFLTGATGYIGSHLLRRLRGRGARVRCLVLPGESLDGAAGDGVEAVRGDVTDAASLRGVGDGIDTVVHCAALMLPNHAERIRHVNVEGTRNMLRCAQEIGARRFIYFSAVSAVYRQKNAYGESKAAAEELVRASGLDYTILRPTMVYGRDGGRHFRELVRLVSRAPGALPVVGSGRARLQPVWIEDVVRAVDLVLDEPVAVGKTYGVPGATVVTFDEYVDLLSAALGRRAPFKLHVPLALCTAAAQLIDLLVGPTLFSPGALRGINEDATLDYREFQADCGYAPAPLEDGLRAAMGRP
jgi:NADH dehydrogenase